jgi:hypothetical protein
MYEKHHHNNRTKVITHHYHYVNIIHNAFNQDNC